MMKILKKKKNNIAFPVIKKQILIPIKKIFFYKIARTSIMKMLKINISSYALHQWTKTMVNFGTLKGFNKSSRFTAADSVRLSIRVRYVLRNDTEKSPMRNVDT
jgi:hypothetical protein